MPLIKRAVEPVQVSRSVVPTHVRNELEFVSNSTLSSIILQLSSLSKHAEDIFGELHRETCCILYRSGQLDERIDRLKQKILQLNPTVEEVSLQDINMRKPFKSSVAKDQQIIAHSSRSQAVTDTYTMCDPPPALHKLDPYREDGKSSMKFYTDPGYFFDLWCHDMKMDAESNLKKQKNKNKNRTRADKNQQQRTIREPKSHIDDYSHKRHGPEFVDNLRMESTSAYQSPSTSSNDINQRPSSLEIQKLSKAAEAYQGQQQKRTSGSDYGYIFTNGQSGTIRKDYQQAGMMGLPRGYNPSYNPRSVSDGEYQAANGYREGMGMSQFNVQARGTPEPRSPSVLTPGGSRPQGPPPAPPENLRVGDEQRVPSGRESLPSPPPLPSHELSSGGRHQPSRPVVRHSSDLPPPPSPPPFQYNTDEMLPSPPSIPAAQHPNNDLNGSDDFILPPPPPPPPSLPPPDSQWARNPGSELLQPPDLQIDSSSDTSSVTTVGATSSGSGAVAGARVGEEKLRDTRSDLLAAIREGLQLRKVEERRLQTERKQQTTGRIDVQSIMEAAFEMRRKAMESYDSDKDNDEDDFGNWSDEG